jgi:hypothetical protein
MIPAAIPQGQLPVPPPTPTDRSTTLKVILIAGAIICLGLSFVTGSLIGSLLLIGASILAVASFYIILCMDCTAPGVPNILPRFTSQPVFPLHFIAPPTPPARRVRFGPTTLIPPNRHRVGGVPPPAPEDLTPTGRHRVGP